MAAAAIVQVSDSCCTIAPSAIATTLTRALSVQCGWFFCPAHPFL
jgi:hypothetical protein